MKNLIYIGNKLSLKGKTVTSIETLGRFLSDEGCKVVSSSSKTNKVLRLLDMLLTVINHRKQTDYVLIDVYSTSNFYYAYFTSQLCRWLHLKYIPILRGGNLGARLKKSPKFSRQIFDNAHINVVPSLYLKLHFNEAGYQNLVFIPNSIQLEHYKFIKRPIDKVSMLWVRSFSKLYNPFLAVKVLKALLDDGIEASLCMVGPDNDGSLEETRALVKVLGVEVEFTGKLSKAEWHAKATDFNVFINTTTIDNTPVSVIEAMALGLPVISTNVGGIPYLLEENIDSILVEPNNANAFKKAIIKLKNNENILNKITTNAHKKVENFDWEVVKQKWFSVLS